MLRGEQTFLTMPGERSDRGGKFKELSAVTESLLSCKTADQLYTKLSSQTIKLTGAKTVLLATYDKYSTKFIVNKPHKSLKSFGWPIDLKLKKPWNFFKQGTLRSNKVVNDRFLNAEFVQTLGIQNILIAPIIISDEVTALLIVANRRGGFKEFHAHVVSMIAAQIAPLLSNFQLQQEEQRRTKQLGLLNRLVTELSLIRDSQQLLRVAAEQICKQFPYYLVATGWVDEMKKEIRFAHVISSKQKESVAEYLPVPFHRGLVGQAVNSGKTLYAGNLSSEKDEYLFLPELKSEMACPVKIGDGVVAILDIQSDQRDAFDDSDRLVIETISSALGSAIQNANAYQNLEKINAQLEEASRMKDEVLQIVAHDFRSPLTVIRGYLDQIIRKEKWLDTQQKEILLTVSQQAFRLQTLADATLKASRFDSGDISFSFEKTDFTSFLRNLLLPWSEKHNFAVKTQKDLPLVKADAGRLQEAMENLISNAIKYSPDGGDISIRVRKIVREDIPVELKSDVPHGNFVLVSISDNGIGIPAEKRDLLFRRFARIHDSRRIEGAGLGLYITKKIIEAHGGRIWLQEQKKGSCFCFALPEYVPTPGSESILIVEDDAHILRLLHRAVSNLGYEVISAWNGREALDKVFRFQPRLIITDLMLPEINGEELIRRLRVNKETASLPIIIFTGKRDFNQEQATENKAHLVYKNQGVDKLLAVIQELLTAKTQN